MKRTFLILLLILLWAAAAMGQEQTAYITDSFQVTLRTGPGVDHKIVAMLASGQSLTLIDAGEEWSQIALPDGRQGFVLNRFISVTPPARIELERIRSAYETLQTRAGELETEHAKLVSENRSLQTQLEKARGELASVETQYASLKAESSDVLSLKTRYERAAASLRESTERVQQLEAQVSELEFNRNIRWFLSGAGVLVLGFLIGFSSKKQRRRSSLL
ncbi:MAG: TIGR04211 family SH3 domain-containing protein [Desulfobacterales bacterium]